MRLRVLHLVAMVGWVVLLTSTATGLVRRVPSRYATINQALDDSTPGDTVLVAPGVYDQYETRLLSDGNLFSSVAFLKGGVALVSEVGAALTTLRMDATQAAPRVLKAFGETGTSLVSGFTVTGTVPTLAGMDYGFSDRCVVRDCIFRDIGNGGVGGALGGVKFDLEVYGCRFENINNNSGSAVNQTSGTIVIEDSEFLSCRNGAIALRFDDTFPHATNAIIRRCRFVDNVKTTGGGAVFVNQYSTGLIEDCWFEGNSTAGVAGAISAGGSTANVVIRANTFVRNYANFVGAVRAGRPGIQVIGNTFFGNWTLQNNPDGGASVFFENGGVLENNVIAGSSGDEAVGVFNGTVQGGCNIFWSNSDGNATFPLGATDLEADPGFCDAWSNVFTVNATSPCLPGYGHPSCTELVGAWGQGCGPISVDPTTWGKLKSGFRSGSDRP